MTLQEAGNLLARAYLPQTVVDVLEVAIAEAERLGGTLQLALGIAEPFADLPWEILSLPRIGVLALRPHIALFRQVQTAGAAPVAAPPGPLRILVAIGSPEAQNQRGELLDMEAELRAILDATEAAQRTDKAFIRILGPISATAVRAEFRADARGAPYSPDPRGLAYSQVMAGAPVVRVNSDCTV
jgi:hypothetical protein